MVDVADGPLIQKWKPVLSFPFRLKRVCLFPTVVQERSPFPRRAGPPLRVSHRASVTAPVPASQPASLFLQLGIIYPCPFPKE
jgi:hypothetical protein